MVYLRIITQLVEFILCTFYDAVILTIIPECAEAIAFYLSTATAAYVSVEEQIQFEVSDSLCFAGSCNYRYNFNKVWDPS